MNRAVWTILLTGVLTAHAFAQNSSENKSFGMNLPSAGSNYGSDEVRAADGTTCRSSMSGNGPKFDMGAIGAPAHQDKDGFAALYGRIVVPLGPKLRRVDCYSLYQLELERLKHELEMAKGTGGDEFTDQVSGAWASEGWSDEPPEEGADNTADPVQADDSEKDLEAEKDFEVQEDTEVENDAEIEEEALAPLGYMPETVEQWTLRGMMD